MYENLLLIILLATSATSAVTDWLRGKIRNKILLIGIATAIVPLVLYYWSHPDLIIVFVTNAAASVIIAIAFYASKVWGAGDSKLWLFINIVFPASRYIRTEFVLFPSMILLMLIFLEAYVFVIVESIYIRLSKKEKGISLGKNQLSLEKCVDLLFPICCLTLLYTIMALIIGEYYEPNRVFFALLGVLIASKLAALKIPYKWLLSVGMLSAYSIICIVLRAKIDIKMLIFTVLIVVVSNASLRFAQKYNYKWIPTADIKEGMILSVWSIQMLSSSRIKGLPKYSDESTKCRLSKEEADAIKRWERSKYGKGQIMIVRYIPFAIFVLIGIITYLAGSKAL